MAARDVRPIARGASTPLPCAVLLPNAEDALIDSEKRREYLLSHLHPHGRFKARFFNALGFRADQWQELESALL